MIFYMSSEALISDSIYKELSIVKDAKGQNRKKYFFISVNGDMVSKLIYDTYRNNDYDPLFKKTLTPDRIERLLSFFNDTIHFLSHAENDYERKLVSDINHYFTTNGDATGTAAAGAGGRLTVGTYAADNDRVFDGIKKPNEDHLICDTENGFFIVADGVTRPHGEYTRDGKSSAYELTKLFCDTVRGTVLNGLSSCRCADDAEKLLRLAFAQGNAGAAKLNAGVTGLFKPATVALCAVIIDGKLCFAYIGDCIGVLIRGKCRYVFAERQTAAAARLPLSKEELYNNYINKPGKKHAYGVINGDPLAASFTVVSHLDLEDGDRIILSTDGLADALTYESVELLGNYGLTSIIASVSEEYDRPPFAKYADDKAMIDITFHKE